MLCCAVVPKIDVLDVLFSILSGELGTSVAHIPVLELMFCIGCTITYCAVLCCGFKTVVLDVFCGIWWFNTNQSDESGKHEYEKHLHVPGVEYALRLIVAD